MRIALVNDLAEGGGTERYLALLAASLQAAGHEPRLVLETELRATLRELDAFRPGGILLNNLQNPGTVRGIAAAYPSVLFAHAPSWICPGAAKFWRDPGVPCEAPYSPGCLAHAWVHRCAPRRPDRWLGSWRRVGAFLEALAVVTRIVTASRWMAAELARAGVPGDRIEVVPLPVEPPDRSGEVAPRGPSIFFAGRLVPEKGAATLVEAVRLRKLPLRIAGDGPERGRLEHLARGTGTVFLGWLPHGEVRREMARSAAVALPSLWPEPFGLSGLEAMAEGTPVAASRVGGIPEWLEDGRTGRLVPAGDPDALGEALEALLKDPDVARRMGEAGRRQARDAHDPARHAGRIVSLLGLGSAA